MKLAESQQYYYQFLIFNNIREVTFLTWFDGDI